MRTEAVNVLSSVLPSVRASERRDASGALVRFVGKTADSPNELKFYRHIH